MEMIPLGGERKGKKPESHGWQGAGHPGRLGLLSNQALLGDPQSLCSSHQDTRAGGVAHRCQGLFQPDARLWPRAHDQAGKSSTLGSTCLGDTKTDCWQTDKDPEL
jgi:hypothetical protein